MRFLLLFIALSYSAAFAQDSRVGIQAFTWEAHLQWKNRWYDLVQSHANQLKSAGFDLVWLPPPSYGEGSGYHPVEWYRFDNTYGSLSSHKRLLYSLNQLGLTPVADVVVNHRSGDHSWAAFKNPEFPSNYICSDDEFWKNPPSKYTDPRDIEIRKQNKKGNADYAGSDYPSWHGSRDLDHTNLNFRKEVVSYLLAMRQLGYRGWRWDMAKGFDPLYVAGYLSATQPYFSVGEYWDTNITKLLSWIKSTQFGPYASSVFDYATYYRLRDYINSGEYEKLPSILDPANSSSGLIAWAPGHSVTFLENHDTGKPQQPNDSFPNNEKLLQAYAFLLTHPGVPFVYWKHFAQWNQHETIAKMIWARKQAGIHSQSAVQSNVFANTYLAFVSPNLEQPPTLIVKIGHHHYQPDPSSWQPVIQGNGFSIWIAKT